jgi:DNA-binding NarL/FixJ family response regulator
MISETNKTRVLVIDDHATLREGIAAVVNAQPDMIVAGEASNGRKAIQQYRVLQPDVTLLDWDLPVLRGEEVISTLIAKFPKARFIVMSALGDDDSIQNALRLGAKAYLCKDMLRRELLPAIRTVHQTFMPGTAASISSTVTSRRG